jgi:hypothetical protein
VFFDTPDLRLSRNGLVLRARRMQKGGDSVVKLRPVVPRDLPRKLRQSPDFTIEADATRDGIVVSGAMKRSVDNADVKRTLKGERPIRKLFSAWQRALYWQSAPEGLDLDQLVAFGPINVAKLMFTPGDLKWPLVAELWFYPDGSRILELSTKCRPRDTLHVILDTRALLMRHGIKATGDQETKTHKALEFFARLHREAETSHRLAS